MNKLLLFILIFISIFTIFSLIICFIDFNKRLKFKRMFAALIPFSRDLGYIIWITGKIRAGKTILMTALTHVLTLKIDSEIKNNMIEIEEKLHEVPFNFIKTKYLENFNNNISHKNNVDLIISEFINSDNLGIKTLNYNLEKAYFNNLKYENKIMLLSRYFDLFSNLLRSNYVYSNILMFNQIKKAYSFNWKNEYFHVKDNLTFPVNEYMIIAYDEKTLQDANDNAIKKLNSDNGSSIAMRLLGNAMRETVYYLATLQDINRLVSYEREIGSSYIYVEECYLVGNRPSLLKVINLLRNINNFIYDLFKFLHKKNLLLYEDRNNYFRKFNSKIRKLEEKIISDSFLIFEISVYSKVDNVGKKITEDLMNKGNYEFTCCLPVCYCWENSNTHFFKMLFDYLIERSIIKRDDLNRTEIDLDYIESVLRKFNNNQSSNVANKESVKSFYD